MSLKELAKHDGQSFIKGLEKIKIEELIAKYPEGVSINAVARQTGKNGEFCTFKFDEEPSMFFNGCTTLNGLVDVWVEGYGSVAAVNAALAEEGSVKVKIFLEIGKNGRTYFNYALVD